MYAKHPWQIRNQKKKKRHARYGSLTILLRTRCRTTSHSLITSTTTFFEVRNFNFWDPQHRHWLSQILKCFSSCRSFAMSFLKLARHPKLANVPKTLTRVSRSFQTLSVKEHSRSGSLPLFNRRFTVSRSRLVQQTRTLASVRYLSSKSDGTDDVPPEEEPYNPQLPATVAVPEVG